MMVFMYEQTARLQPHPQCVGQDFHLGSVGLGLAYELTVIMFLVFTSAEIYGSGTLHIHLKPMSAPEI